jgi:thioredoxin-related protein/tetratricopeptide (TPR) repeat protein
MKYIIFYFLIFSSLSYGQIRFENTNWIQIKQQAQAENKLIFLDAYTSWCGPCKWMEKFTFTDKEVAKFYNTNFINAKFDMEKGEGETLAKIYEVQAFPTLLFINQKGELVYGVTGAKNPEDFIALGKKVLEIGIPIGMEKKSTIEVDDNKAVQEFPALAEKFKKGERSKIFLISYMDSLKSAGLSTDEALDAYFETHKDSMLTKSAWDNVISYYMRSISSKTFNYVFNNRKKYLEKIPFQPDMFILLIFNDELRNMVNNKIINQKKYFEIREKLLKSQVHSADITAYRVDIVLYSKLKDWVNYTKSAEWIANYYIERKDTKMLNWIAWHYAQRISDKTQLEKAEKWIRISIEIKPSAANHDTCANILYKIGKIEEAIQMQQKAIDLAKQAGEEYSIYEENLKKMQ